MPFMRITFNLTALLLLTSTSCAGQSAMPPELMLDLGKDMKLELVLIPAGKFMMGSPETEKERANDETQHEVTLSQAFYMGKFEVTVGQFARFVEAAGYQTQAETEGFVLAWDGKEYAKFKGANWRKPGFEQGLDYPVCEVSWNDATAFCKWATERTAGVPPAPIPAAETAAVRKWVVRLPTEAEWEYAARAGTTTAYPWGENQDDGKGWGNSVGHTIKRQTLNADHVFNNNNSDDGWAFTAPVGKFRANGFGLHDTLGNVWEWCGDWYGNYAAGAATDPKGAADGQFRVRRGGCSDDDLGSCRAARRSESLPGGKSANVGFRVVVGWGAARTP